MKMLLCRLKKKARQLLLIPHRSCWGFPKNAFTLPLERESDLDFLLLGFQMDHSLKPYTRINSFNITAFPRYGSSAFP